MSDHDHPSLYVTCCKPFTRWGPSGSPIKFHSWTCPAYPNQQIRGPIAGRSETHSAAARMAHDWNTCDLDPCLVCDYFDSHIDDADDEWTG